MKDLGGPHTVVIIGAGPGGLQTAYFLQELGIDYVIIEKGAGPGEFFRSFPRGRRLISLNKIHNGEARGEIQMRWDWNSLLEEEMGEHFKKFDTEYYPEADSMVAYLADFAARHAINILPHTEALRIEKDDDMFVVTTDSGMVRGDCLVVTTGTPIPHLPPIPGIEFTEQYADFGGELDKYRNKRVLVIGKGNSAFETAGLLLPLAQSIDLVSPQFLREAARTHFAGDVRSINLTFLDTFFFKQENAVINACISRISRQGDIFTVELAYTEDGEVDEFVYDNVICCAGFRFDHAPFVSTCQPVTDETTGLPNLTCDWESINVPGMFFAGALTQANDYRGSGSSFVKGLRHNAQVLAKHIAERTGQPQRPRATVAASADAFTADVFARVRSSASLWHLWASLCDVYIFDLERCCFEVLRDVPQRRVLEQGLFGDGHGFVLQFTHANPTNPEERKSFSPVGFIHPMLKLYSGTQQLGESHVLEDVHAKWAKTNRWKAPVLDIFAAFRVCVAEQTARANTAFHAR